MQEVSSPKSKLSTNCNLQMISEDDGRTISSLGSYRTFPEVAPKALLSPPTEYKMELLFDQEG